MKITAATVENSDVISSIISESNKEVAETFNLTVENNPKHPSFCNVDWVLSDFERGEEYFLYRKDGVVVGCVAFENPRPGVAYLNRLSVLPGYRCYGIGSELVRFVINYAEKKDVERVSIGIIAKHTDLKGWYEKLGFVAGLEKSFPHLPFDVLYMSYLVKP